MVWWRGSFLIIFIFCWWWVLTERTLALHSSSFSLYDIYMSTITHRHEDWLVVEGKVLQYLKRGERGNWGISFFLFFREIYTYLDVFFIKESDVWKLQKRGERDVSQHWRMMVSQREWFLIGESISVSLLKTLLFSIHLCFPILLYYSHFD